MDLVLIGRIALTAIFVGVGVMHFARPKFFLHIMPPYIPFPRAAVAVSGAAEIALGISLWTSYAQLAAWGLVALLVAVAPVHVYMVQEPEKFASISVPALWGRLAFQFVLIYWAYRYTAL